MKEEEKNIQSEELMKKLKLLESMKNKVKSDADSTNEKFLKALKELLKDENNK